jgi:hypothetical protein
MLDWIAFGREPIISCCSSPSKSILYFIWKWENIWSCKRLGNWFLWAKFDADWTVSLYCTTKKNTFNLFFLTESKLKLLSTTYLVLLYRSMILMQNIQVHDASKQKDKTLYTHTYLHIS